MRILVVATGGSRGDVQPGMVLAQALQRAGHGVKLCVTQDFATIAATYHVDICPVRINTQELVESLGGIEMIESGKNPMKMFRALASLLRPLYEQTITDVTPEMKQTDLVLAHLGAAFCIESMAEIASVPVAIFTLAPTAPTRELSSAMLPHTPEWFPLKPLYNRLTNTLSAQASWSMLGTVINELRTKRLHLPPHTARSFQATLSRLPMLHGISPSVVPRPSDWPPHVHMTGYWFAPDSNGWVPPSALAQFLNAGPPPIYVGFGSMSTRDPEQSTQLVIEAIQRSGQRAVLATGWAGLRSDELPATIVSVDDVPHGWLFPQVAAAVHHGGAGTTAAAFRAGIPSVLVPHFADQFFWGYQAEKLGVSPKAIPRKKLRAHHLAMAISQAVSDPQLRRRAADLGAQIRTEDGAQRAVEVIEQIRV